MDRQVRLAMAQNQVLRNILASIGAEAKEEIKISPSYHGQVSQVKKIIKQDSTGLVNTITGFAINAANTNISIQTSNSNFTKILNNWLSTLNFNLKMASSGIQSLANQYFKERWQASSFLVLRTEWESVNGVRLPTKMYYLDGGSIYNRSKSNIIDINSSNYILKYGPGKKDFYPLRDSDDVKYFFQNPYGMWGDKYPTPFLIRSGSIYNALFLNIIKNKGASVAKRAIEHLFLAKKGFKEAALEEKSEYIYNEKELREADNLLKEKMRDKSYSDDMLSLYSNFDSDFSHLIPPYKEILNKQITAPAEMGLLASLGFIELISSKNRQGAILNPAPFKEEVLDGVNDFNSMLNDVVLTIALENKKAHRKYINVKVVVNSSAIKAFIDHEAKQLIRSAYDRGTLSKETYDELGVGVDYDLETERIKQEKKNGIDELMVPNPTQYTDLFLDNIDTTKDDEDTTPDKVGPEKRNYFNAEEELENAPYTNISDLPNSIKSSMTRELQQIWMDSANELLENGEEAKVVFKKSWDLIESMAVKKKKKWKLK